ncbi:MAG: S8 family serine peptidase [Candidatus Pacebacteria bacterium]|nr:S8 family serine peptidase [Candidatus Paceibacterota bacterium]
MEKKQKTIASELPKFLVVGLVILVTGLVSLNSIVALEHNTANKNKKVETKNEVKGQKNDQQYIPGQVIVKLKEGESSNYEFLRGNRLKSAKRVIKENKSGKNIKAREVAKAHGLDRIYLAEFSSEENLAGVLERLNKDPRVEYAEPDYIYRTTETIPSDPSFSKLWGLHNTATDADIDAPEAWDLQKGSKEIIVAVIDSGVDYNHPDLAANIWTNPGEIADNGVDDDNNGFVDDYYGWDFYSNDNDPMGATSHGTHCAGTIGAVGNNGVGVVGVNWNVSIMSIKFMGTSGGTTYGAINSINYAINMGADIMSNSWGANLTSAGIENAISAANDAGILFVASAGNSGQDNDNVVTPNYPSSSKLDNVVAVAATDSNDNKASWSSYGATTVDLGAPGVSIYSTVMGGGYATYSGTSMACPHVAGAAALIKAHYPTMTSEGLKARLLGGVDPIPSMAGITVSEGRLNVFNSLSLDNVPPIANAGGSQFVSDTDSNGTETVTLDGSTSTDSDGYIASYQWFKSNSTTESTLIGIEEIITHPFLVNDDYLITLIVTDDKGATDTNMVTIIVNPNEPPFANAGGNQTVNDINGDGQELVTLDGSDSYDPDGSISSYVWDFGDGSTGSGISPTHTYSTIGIFTATLTVTDNGGAIDTDIATIEIVEFIPDTVTVTNIKYDTKKSTLLVYAISNGNGAVLTASAGGFENIAMKYDSRLKVFKATIRKIAPDPHSVTVTSSLGGETTYTW